MGWVTLTARKKELKAKHSATQFQALCISRQKRQLAREKMLNTTLFQNNENGEVKKERTQYNSLTQALTKYSDELTAYKDALKKAKNSDKDRIKALNGDFSNGIVFEVDNAKDADIITDDKGREYYWLNNGNNDYELVTVEAGKEYADAGEGNAHGEITPDMLAYTKDDNGTAVTSIDITVPDGTVFTSADKEDEGETKSSNFDELEDTYYAAEATLPTAPAGYSFGSLSTFDGEDLEAYIETITKEIDTIKTQITNEKNELQYEYQEEVDNIKSFWETEKELIEAEASDEETVLDLQQTEVETEMEAISNEMQAVGDGISSQIQQTTIKLA